ncbi:hypothetical protein D3C87_1585790 [compost metagenome]
MPGLITLNDFGGDFSAWYEHIYDCFCEDFLRNPLAEFQGKRMGLKRHPLTDDKEATFYHITHEGQDEQNREPNMRRMERILWVKHLIRNADHASLMVWRNKRKNDENILIYHPKEGYLIVLADRGNYILPWTAYLVEYEWKRKKLEAEYQAYKKAEAAK